jgi:soluble lytic murein transglycosylase-like protein
VFFVTQEVEHLCLPRKVMRERLKVVVGLCLGVLAWCVPAQAQIAVTVDADGKRVFVNAEPSASRRANGQNRNGVGRSESTAGTEALRRLAQETAERHEIDPALVIAMIEAESGWNTRAVSSKGAQGLMQLIPATAERFRVGDVFDPAQNVEGGVKYLRWLLERYDGNLDKTLAAYNAGEGAVDRAGGVPDYVETRAYVQKVSDFYFRSDSGRQPRWWNVSRPIYRLTDARGRVVFTNE